MRKPIKRRACVLRLGGGGEKKNYYARVINHERVEYFLYGQRFPVDVSILNMKSASKQNAEIINDILFY